MLNKLPARARRTDLVVMDWPEGSAPVIHATPCGGRLAHLAEAAAGQSIAAGLFSAAPEARPSP